MGEAEYFLQLIINELRIVMQWENQNGIFYQQW